MSSARVCKPNSVEGAIYLGFASPRSSSGSNQGYPWNTALHSSKDLAVSPCGCPQTRLCSHLLRPPGSHDRDYLLLTLSIAAKVSVRTFLSNTLSELLPNALMLLYHTFLQPCKLNSSGVPYLQQLPALQRSQRVLQAHTELLVARDKK